MICFLITYNNGKLTNVLPAFMPVYWIKHGTVFFLEDYLNTIYFYSLKNIEIWQMFLVLVGAVRTGFKTGCSDFFPLRKCLIFRPFAIFKLLLEQCLKWDSQYNSNNSVLQLHQIFVPFFFTTSSHYDISISCIYKFTDVDKLTCILHLPTCLMVAAHHF